MTQVESLGNFACKKCGKKFKWKPTLAGRTVTCKCGATLHVPVSASGGGVAGSGGGGASAYAGAIPAPAGSGPVSAFGFPAARKMSEPTEADAVNSTFIDWHLPIILIIGGSILSVIQLSFFSTAKLSIPLAIPVFLIGTVIDLVMLFVGGLIVVKLFDTALGHPGQALLKMAAIAIAPTAIANIIMYAIEDHWGMVGGSLALGMYYALFYYFFDMDFIETIFLCVIVWLVRMWVGFLIIGLILSMFGSDGVSGRGGTGVSLPGAGGGSGGMVITGDDSTGGDLDSEDAEDGETLDE